MKKQTESIFKPDKEIAVTPFGVDCKIFKPVHRTQENERIIIGTVKKMDQKYGISTLIEAFSLIVKRYANLELVLVGDGPQMVELKKLATRLGIINSIKFIGAKPHVEIPAILNSFDIFCALSTQDSESFGVAVIEASACGLPVIVSNAGGLPEVAVDGQTGFLVERNNPEAAAEKIEELINDAALRKKMGQAGRQFVLQNYEWQKSADIMEKLYEEVINDYQK